MLVKKQQMILLHNNNLKTAGISKIMKAMQDISTLTVFSISNNNVGEEAADIISQHQTTGVTHP